MNHPAQLSEKRPEDEGLPIAHPDGVEEHAADTIDDAIPTHGYEMMMVVGLGGSAGSLGELQKFFKAMPVDSGMAFVVILHLSPTHESSVPEILGRCTTMKVLRAEDDAKVEANTVYVIPPGKHLTSEDGELKLTDLEPQRGKRVAVDLFFRSLADTHGPHAIAIVLSGADGDGANGLKRIKERGGLTIAQNPTQAEIPSMPQSAIHTGMVDWVLETEAMPQCLMEFLARERRTRVISEEGLLPQPPPKEAQGDIEVTLREVLAFLRARTGRDFLYYKRATMVRRISRRMQINAVDDLAGYLDFLRMHPGEAGALILDLLISVTNFFRDREAFEAVEQLMPRLFQGKGPGDTVRIWVPACATGEEAYSLAILALEQAGKMDSPPAIQVFGCDLDDAAIRVARAGVYSDTIIADVSEERLRRFFMKDHRGYHIRREVRETVLFAAHDLLQDAPFSRIDLVSCRNLLIYLNRNAQERVLDIFHFALRPGALLFLGTTESVAEGSPLFATVEKKQRIYAQRAAQRTGLPVPSAPSMLMRTLEAHKAERGDGPVLPHKSFNQGFGQLTAAVAGHPERASLSSLHFKLLERLAPPSVLVDKEHNIVHLSENAGKYLQLSGGEPSINLLKLVHPELRVELHAALFQATETKSTVTVQSVSVIIDGVSHAVDIRVSPAGDLAPDHMLIILEVREASDADDLQQPRRDGPESVVNRLAREAEALKARLRDTVEQHEASCEELKASNEELQAMNEELRSASEELETSREELQSINEELSTVNQELKSNLDELSHANGDMRNLMASTAIPTLFLDREFRIMRFTPSAVDLFRLIAGDVGRPLADINHHLNYPELRADAERVLNDLVPIEREVWDATPNERCYLARLLPYRTPDDHIGGVVLTLIDVTEARRSAKALAQELADTQHLQKISGQLILEGNIDALYHGVLDAAAAVMRSDMASLRILDPKKNQMRLLAFRGFPPEAASYVEWLDINSNKSSASLTNIQRVVIADVSKTSHSLGPKEAEFFKATGIQALQATPLMSRSGALVGLLSTHWKQPHEPAERDLRLFDVLARQAADLIERKRSEEALRESEARHAFLLKLSDVLRDEGDPAQVQLKAACVLGEHLGADRVGYAETHKDGKSVAITWNYNHGVKDIEGSYTHACGSEMMQKFRAGDPVMRDDIANDTSLTDQEKKSYADMQIGALVNVPLVKGGLLLAVLFVHYRQAHEWTSAERTIIRDVAERIWSAVERARAERDLARSLAETEAAHQDAKTASKAKDDFLAILSHELRTPLAPVLMALELIEESDELSEPNLEVLRTIERNVEIEKRLIDDLLDVTRIAHGKLMIIKSDGDVHDAIGQAAQICQQDAQAKKQKFDLRLSAKKSRCHGDFVRLQQAFWNLLQNACKFMPEEGTVTVATRDDKDGLVIDVTDQGAGMDEETLHRVFQPFEQGPRLVTRQHGGLGLGLAISRAIVEAHAGTLTATSKGLGEGCTFTIKLPREVK